MTDCTTTIPPTGSMMTIPAMPGLWTIDSLVVGHNGIRGALAHWAVFQSPYVVPDGLAKAIEEFAAGWPYEEYAKFSGQDLLVAVRNTMEACPTILSWNESKKGSGDIGFRTRHSRPAPDFDFIDLDALARNITHDLTLQAQVEKAQGKWAPTGD